MKQGRNTFDTMLTRYGAWLLLAVVFALGLLLRWVLFPFASADMQIHLTTWMERVRELGGFNALGTQIGDYAPAYMLLIAATSYLRFDAIVIIKAISTGADILLAASSFLLVWQLTRSQRRAAFAAAFVFLLPTVILNSAMWGQCDALFTSFLVLFLFFYFRGSPYLAMLCYWAALAFKLQAIFLAPLVVLLLAAHKLKLRHVLAGFGSYFVLFLPAIIVRGNIAVLWQVYMGQSQNNAGRLSLAAPNVYAWLDYRADLIAEYAQVGVLFGVCVIGACMYVLWLHRGWLDTTGTLYAALFFAFLVPHVMPRMHERYFFIADILALLLACCYVKRAPYAIAMQLISILVYLPFLLQIDNLFSLPTLALASVVVLCFLAHTVFRYFGVSCASGILENATAQATAKKDEKPLA